MTLPLRIEFERAISIKREDVGLAEPSGLAFSPDGSLWTVSDDTEKIFRINTQGQLLDAVNVDNRGLEGLAFDPTGRLWMVDEDAHKILVHDPQTGDKITDRLLKDVDGYCAIEKEFEGDDNKGLEGVTYDPLRDEILLLKEALPGLLIAVTNDLERIVSIDRLEERNGFFDNDVGSDGLDFSGICYDAARDLFWIVSDKGRRVFTFDRRRGRAVHRLALALGQGREVRKAEGVAIDADRLYVVSDEDAELYEFRIVQERPANDRL